MFFWTSIWNVEIFNNAGKLIITGYFSLKDTEDEGGYDGYDEYFDKMTTNIDFVDYMNDMKKRTMIFWDKKNKILSIDLNGGTLYLIMYLYQDT